MDYSVSFLRPRGTRGWGVVTVTIQYPNQKTNGLTPERHSSQLVVTKGSGVGTGAWESPSDTQTIYLLGDFTGASDTMHDVVSGHTGPGFSSLPRTVHPRSCEGLLPCTVGLGLPPRLPFCVPIDDKPVSFSSYLRTTTLAPCFVCDDKSFETVRKCDGT